jgi:hypothetical protein
MFLCVLLPAWYRWQKGAFDAFESIHVVSFIFFVFFGLGAIWTRNDPAEVAFDKYLLDYLPRATTYCFMGLLALLAGYFGPWFHARPPRQTVQYPAGTQFLGVMGVIGFAAGMSKVAWSQAKDLGTSLPWAVGTLNQLTPLFFFVWALGCLLVASGRATAGQRRLFWFFLVPGTTMFLVLSLTDKSLAMTLIGVPVMALWYVKRKVPWISLAVLTLLLVFVVFPFYNTYRTLDPHIPRSKRVAITADQARQWDKEEYLERSVAMTVRRLSMINSVSVVVRDTGRWVPYAYGDTLFLPALAYIIPRAVWPEKPLFSMGRDFGETFRVVHILDPTTNIAATVPGELYWNFGIAGIVFGMALWGLVLRFCYRRYGEGPVTDPVLLAVHMVLLIQFVHFGGGLAAQVVIVVRTLILLEAICWLSRRFGLLRVQRVPAQHAAPTPRLP